MCNFEKKIIGATITQISDLPQREKLSKKMKELRKNRWMALLYAPTNKTLWKTIPMAEEVEGLIGIDSSVLIEYFRKTKKENSFLFKLLHRDFQGFVASIIVHYEII